MHSKIHTQLHYNWYLRQIANKKSLILFLTRCCNLPWQLLRVLCSRPRWGVTTRSWTACWRPIGSGRSEGRRGWPSTHPRYPPGRSSEKRSRVPSDKKVLKLVWDQIVFLSFVPSLAIYLQVKLYINTSKKLKWLLKSLIWHVLSSWICFKSQRFFLYFS